MKLKFGMIVTDGRGKLGGHVMSKNRGGAYARTKVTPSNPQTTSQQDARNRLTSLSQSFRGLTQPQIAGWNGAVANFSKTNVFGDVVNPSGVNLYVKLNSILLLLGVASIDSAPLPVEIPFTTLEVSDTTAGGSAIDLDAIPATYRYIVEATAPQSPGKNNINNQYRVIDIITGTGAAVTDEDISAAYAAKFGAPAVGQKVGVRVKIASAVTGQFGQYASVQYIVTA